MFADRQRWDRDRLFSAVAVAAVHAAVGGLLFLKTSPIALTRESPLKIFNVAPEPPPPPPIEKAVPAKVVTDAEEGEAAPPGLKAQATPIVAPPPAVRLKTPSPIVAAPVAGIGAAPSAGASDIDGPGTGAGGEGDGTGSGGSGDGTGGGGAVTRPRLLSGEIVERDYPDAAGDAGAQGTVDVWFEVGADGRVSGCRVTGSSGNADLDTTTCRLIERRFRYEPARNARGEAVSDMTGWVQEWWLGPRWRRPRRR